MNIVRSTVNDGRKSDTLPDRLSARDDGIGWIAAGQLRRSNASSLSTHSFDLTVRSAGDGRGY